MPGRFDHNGRLNFARLLMALSASLACTIVLAKEEPARIEIPEAILLESQNDIAHARVFFERSDYQKAILFLRGHEQNSVAKWILAESMFRLGLYDKAQAIFTDLNDQANGRSDKEKIAMRLFEIAFKQGNEKLARQKYKILENDFKKVPGRMAYMMGRMLYNLGDLEPAVAAFLKVTPGDDYFMRARYILAAIKLAKVSREASLLAFREVEKSKVIATEDFWVRDLAILAQMRINCDAHRMEQAIKDYLRLSLTSAFLETATSEIVNTLIVENELALLGVDRFLNLPLKKRELLAKRAMKSALEVMERYQKKYKISWQTPELLSLMAELLVITNRYDDARKAYDQLIDHYRPLRMRLLSPSSTDEIWPYFVLDYQRKHHDFSKIPLIPGIPSRLVRNLRGVEEILSLRDRILENGKRLLERSELIAARGDEQEYGLLKVSRSLQEETEKNYRSLVLEEQALINKRVAHRLGAILSKAEFKRAQMESKDKKGVQDKLKIIHDFTAENMDLFDSQIKAIDKGVSP